MAGNEPILLFPRIDLGQAERLSSLVDCFGEAQEAIGKIVTRGFDARTVDGINTNRAVLEASLRELNAAVAALVASGDIDGEKLK
ncbi:MAG: hypothetical protein ACM31P_00865 [Actinomycetota bacterium]